VGVFARSGRDSLRQGESKQPVNQQIKAGLSAVKEFLNGRLSEAKVAEVDDHATQEVVSAEVVTTVSAQPANGAAAEPGEKKLLDTQENPSVQEIPGTQEIPPTQEIPRVSESEAAPETQALNLDQTTTPQRSEDLSEQNQTRQLLLDRDYFDETVQSLRAGSSAAERAAAAYALGMVGSQRGTAHLIAAMFDEAPEVRRAAEEALRQIGDPTVAGAATVTANDDITEAIEPAPATAATTDSTVEKDRNDLPVQVPEASAALPDVVPAIVDVASAAAVVEQADPTVETAVTPASETVVAPASEIAVAPAPEELVTPESETVIAPDTQVSPTIAGSVATSDQDQLLAEEQNITEKVAKIEQQMLELAAGLKESEGEVRWRTEREAKLRAEAAARQAEEEELRKRADEAAATRRAQEREFVAAEQSARLTAEAEARRCAEEELDLRVEAASLRLQIADVARRRAEMEAARQEAAEATRQSEALRARDEASSHHEAELARLAAEEAALKTATDEVLSQQANVTIALKKAASEIEKLREEQAEIEATMRAEAEKLRSDAAQRNNEADEQLRIALAGLRQKQEEVDRRRAEVEAAREKADEEAQRLLGVQARMDAAEQARAQAEVERTKLEADIKQRLETERQLLQDAQRRYEEEQERLQAQMRQQAEKEQQRLAEVETMKARAESQSKELFERERQILAQVDSLRIADAEARRRITDAEARRRTADDAYRLIAEQVQRVEAEAHARAKEEERMQSKLESERRHAANAALSRAEQEKRIRAELEMFRRLEQEERPRFEEATLQLAEAEARLQERKDRLKEDAEVRTFAEEQFTAAERPADSFDRVQSFTTKVQSPKSQDQSRSDLIDLHTTAVAQPVIVSEFQTAQAAVASLSEKSEGSLTANSESIDVADASDELAAAATITPAVSTYLNSVDPYKRAAAVSELARSGSQDAFERIVACFDDHSLHVRNAAARALGKLEPGREVDTFNRALEGASAERRRNIGGAIAASGLATEAINNLAGDNREDTYKALSILFVMAKTGAVEPLVQALAEHRDDEIGKAVSKLLSLSGHQVAEKATGADSKNT
jgi:hypothetical protein